MSDGLTNKTAADPFGVPLLPGEPAGRSDQPPVRFAAGPVEIAKSFAVRLGLPRKLRITAVWRSMYGVKCPLPDGRGS